MAQQDRQTSRQERKYAITSGLIRGTAEERKALGLPLTKRERAALETKGQQ